MTLKSFRVGLVGAGYVSEFHIRALRRLESVKIAGITDVLAERARTVAERFELPPAFPSLKDMAAAGLDVVHVLTPPATHASVALEALQLGCHVLVEKPVATSVEDCDCITQAARSAGRSVGVNHSYLRNPTVVRALDAVRQGFIGDVLTVDYFRSSDYPPYRGGPLPPQYGQGGYPFRDLGVHGVYLIEAFLGEIREATWQFAGRGREPLLLYDEWRVLLDCRGGSGQIQLSWNVRPLQHYLIVQGTKGVLRADLFTHLLTIKKTTRLPKSIERAANALSESGQILVQIAANFLRFATGRLYPYQELQTMVADFYHCLAAGKPAPVSPEQAKPVLKWVEKIAQEADLAKAERERRFSRPLTATTLVTGATGFIGGHLMQRLLAQNERVRVLVRRDPPPEWAGHPSVELVCGDLADPKAAERAVTGCQLIYHLAGPVGDASADELERGMVAATRNVVESALRHQVSKLVYISSLSVLHNAAARGSTPIQEDWPLEPHSEKRGAYSQTKLEAEKLVLEAVRNRSLPAVILRPGRILGSGTHRLLPEVARRAGGNLVILGSGDFPLPFLCVEDLVDAILLAASRSDLSGRVFHLVSPEKLTQNDYVREYLRVTGEKARVIRIPMPVMYSLAFGIQVLAAVLRRPAPLSVYRLRSALTPLTFDCTAAEKGLGWRPKVSLKEGLAATLTASNT